MTRKLLPVTRIVQSPPDVAAIFEDNPELRQFLQSTRAREARALLAPIVVRDPKDLREALLEAEMRAVILGRPVLPVVLPELSERSSPTMSDELLDEGRRSSLRKDLNLVGTQTGRIRCDIMNVANTPKGAIPEPTYTEDFYGDLARITGVDREAIKQAVFQINYGAEPQLSLSDLGKLVRAIPQHPGTTVLDKATVDTLGRALLAYYHSRVGAPRQPARMAPMTRAPNRRERRLQDKRDREAEVTARKAQQRKKAPTNIAPTTFDGDATDTAVTVTQGAAVAAAPSEDE